MFVLIPVDTSQLFPPSRVSEDPLVGIFAAQASVCVRVALPRGGLLLGLRLKGACSRFLGVPVQQYKSTREVTYARQNSRVCYLQRTS